MDSVRRPNETNVASIEPCCRCGCIQGRWDRIASKAYCPRCEEALIVGELDPVREQPEEGCCAVCGRSKTLCFVTFPLNALEPVELDLCGEHLRQLLARRLPPHAFHQLRRLLLTMELAPTEIFLLHEAFYNRAGRALKPIKV